MFPVSLRKRNSISIVACKYSHCNNLCFIYRIHSSQFALYEEIIESRFIVTTFLLTLYIEIVGQAVDENCNAKWYLIVAKKEMTSET